LVEHSLGKGEVTSSILVIGSRKLGLRLNMHGTWYILRSVWSAVLVSYLLLYIVAGKRLTGSAKKRSGIAFWVVAVLAVLRLLGWYVLGHGQVYRFAVLFAGTAAGLAGLDLVRMLAENRQDSPIGGRSDERIQPLKLS
jgi:hypothetical protein